MIHCPYPKAWHTITCSITHSSCHLKYRVLHNAFLTICWANTTETSVTQCANVPDHTQKTPLSQFLQDLHFRRAEEKIIVVQFIYLFFLGLDAFSRFFFFIKRQQTSTTQECSSISVFSINQFILVIISANNYEMWLMTSHWEGMQFWHDFSSKNWSKNHLICPPALDIFPL